MNRASWTSIGARALALQLLVLAPLAAQDPPTPAPVHQHDLPAAAHDMMMRAREGSGTAWLPDASPMASLHATVGTWSLILHGNGFLQYVHEPGPRGGSQLNSTNWVMGMARRPLLGGVVGLRSMLSAEPFTIPRCGYPILLSNGVSCSGEAPHDLQHPHDLFTELAAEFSRQVFPAVGVQLYAALAGEPALGPVAFPHRWSAMANPLAPISHHWFDGTHVTFGVLTGGVYGERWKLEGSLFNGRTPDEDRYDLDLATLNSHATRLWWLPNERWAIQLSAGRLDEAAGEPAPDERRLTLYTTSATYHQRLGELGLWATTGAAGRSVRGETGANAFLLETSVTLRERHTLFGRTEWAEKSGAGHDHGGDAGTPEAPLHGVGAVALGYVLHLQPIRGWLPGVGGRASVSFIPRDLEPVYGGRHRMGFTIFLNLRHAEAVMEAM
jgi:hypothetical protein